jgi:hypothetical protein
MKKKNILKFIVALAKYAMIVFVAVIGFSFFACDNSGNEPNDTRDDESSSGVSVGDNAVGGKTYYQYSSKIEFAVSTGTNGTYTGYRARYNNDDNYGYALDANGKYQWDIEETGTYTWNEDAKTVTLRPGKLSGANGELLDKARYKSYVQAQIDANFATYKKEHGWTQAQLDEYIKEQLASTGYSSLTQYIDAMVNEAFGDHPYTYSFSTDGKSLFMQEALPQPKGTDELAGKTYNGVTWDNDQGKDVKDPNQEYVFSDNKTYTYTSSYDDSQTRTGSYSYDSTQKWVYFSKVKISGKTAAEYYETVTIENGNRFINDDAYKAAETNGMFKRYNSYMYDPTQKLIGYL